jgi:hypothetical protein
MHRPPAAALPCDGGHYPGAPSTEIYRLGRLGSSSSTREWAAKRCRFSHCRTGSLVRMASSLSIAHCARRMSRGRLEDGLITVFGDDTLAADEKAFFPRVRDVVDAAVSKATFPAGRAEDAEDTRDSPHRRSRAGRRLEGTGGSGLITTWLERTRGPVCSRCSTQHSVRPAGCHRPSRSAGRTAGGREGLTSWSGMLDGRQCVADSPARIRPPQTCGCSVRRLKWALAAFRALSSRSWLRPVSRWSRRRPSASDADEDLYPGKHDELSE